MEVVQVLRMNGGLGETSYATNSLVQRKVISMTKPITEEAITQVYRSVDTITNSFCIAELGCSSGPNTLVVAAELLSIVHRLSRSHGRQLPEFQIFLNDLLGNDFNSIFHSLLPQFRAQLNREMESESVPCFVYGVPGSFYGRLFAANNLHLFTLLTASICSLFLQPPFVHSSYSLMWLSKVHFLSERRDV
ncbi:salicylate carboxymethyltransferase-like [Salvia divinorum]|uniref:Salicylate carboxymethyltransferase-like n=1 Tax=Salvia divinorum TaxID=28513 RepID=A0ABD1IGU9_SALDI